MSQGFLSRFEFGANARDDEPTFKVEIVDAAGVTVADVEKTLYIRRKKN